MGRAIDIARYISSICAVDNLKVQKLLYYSQAVHMVLNNSASAVLFKDEIQAWQYGPVVPSVYHKLKKYGLDNIPASSPKHELSENEVRSVNMVVDYYGNMTGTRLINKTHQEEPWKNVYVPNKKNIIITPESIYEYFKDKLIFGER